jgi:predicted secreted protein
VVGAEFGWATERALLARDPRRLRFAGYQLAVAAVLALAWWAVQSLLAVAVAALLQAGGGIVAGAAWSAPAHRAALAAALVVTLVYGLLGAACALVLRGALAGVVAVGAYGLLVELVLAPQWDPASGWTLRAAGTRLAGQGDVPLGRAVLVIVVASAVILAGCLALYARRQVRD